MAIRLKQSGLRDFVVLEEADEVGGTWRDNRYPGAACDVQSHLYSFSFEPNPGWTRQFAPQAEILEYLVRCTAKYGIRDHLRLRARVVGARFDDRDGLWIIETSDGGTLAARVLVSACGGLSRPAWPKLRGLETFEGSCFHSARWPSSFSVKGKSVAVIGTGASAIQIVPSIAPEVSRLFVLQRTPPWILPKPDADIPASRRAWFRRWPVLQWLSRAIIYWRNELNAVSFVLEPGILKLIGERSARAYLEQSVRDPALRARLQPRYAMGCKRILPTNDYYSALERENVRLVTESVREINGRAIVLQDGAELAVDTIVLATGFEAAEPFVPFPIRGRGGLELADVWGDGAEAYLGTTINGFPNFFMLVGPNTALGHSSMILMIEAQVAYVLDALRTMASRGLRSVDVRADVQARYNVRLRLRLSRTVWSTGCASWYLTRSGKNTTLWPGFTIEYRLRTRRFDLRSYTAQPLVG